MTALEAPRATTTGAAATRTATAATVTGGPIRVDPATTMLDVVVPVYNEEADLEACVRRLHDYLSTSLPFSFRITIADNASTDATLPIARRLASELDAVSAVHLAEKGRGLALRTVWAGSTAGVLAYLDVDMSTDLAALLPLIAPLVSGHSDIAIGSRLARGSRVVRGAKREVISRCYNLLLRGTLAARFSDAQCGFKAIRADVAHRLLPMTSDNGWFFDTELLVLAERAGLRIHEVPVDWVDDPGSTVDLMATAIADLKGIARIGRGLLSGAIPVAELRRDIGRDIGREPAGDRDGDRDGSGIGVPAGLGGQLGRFAVIGVVSTIAYLLLYVVLRPDLGAQVANLTALLVTAIANTTVNRRVTFGVTGRHRVVRHQIGGLIAFGLGLGLTSGALALLQATGSHGRPVEVGVLVAANLAATVVRFVLLRTWLRPARPAGA